MHASTAKSHKCAIVGKALHMSYRAVTGQSPTSEEVSKPEIWLKIRVKVSRTTILSVNWRPGQNPLWQAGVISNTGSIIFELIAPAKDLLSVLLRNKVRRLGGALTGSTLSLASIPFGAKATFC